MTTVSMLKRILLAIVVLGSMIIAGASATHATGVHAARHTPPSDIVCFLLGRDILLSTGGGIGSATTILTATVSAGSWVLQANGSLVNWGPSDYTRCAIFNDSGPLGGVTTMVGDGSLPGSHGPGTYAASFATTTNYTTATSGVLALKCWHDSPTPPGYGPGQVGSSTVMWAHAAPAIDAATQ